MVAWEEIVVTAPWTGRGRHATVFLPDGSLMLCGGITDAAWMNDTWLSPDSGLTWQRQSVGPWTERSVFDIVVLSNGDVLLGPGVRNAGIHVAEFYKTSDRGVNWTLVNGSPEFGDRAGCAFVCCSNGDVLVIAGSDATHYNVKTIWVSHDGGASFSYLSDLPCGTIQGHRVVVMTDGSLILTGGYDDTIGGKSNAVYRSTNNGLTWNLQKAHSPGAADGYYPARSTHISVALPGNKLIVSMGESATYGRLRDTWKSDDLGVTWKNLNIPFPAVV